MIDTMSAAPGAGVPASKGLIARIFGVIFSPRGTYAGVAARPRAFGALAFATLTIAVTSFVFLSTEVGQIAMLDQQMRMMESFGIQIPDQAYAQMEAGASRGRYLGPVAVLIFVPIVCTIVAGLFLAVFNAVLGGEASFTQTFAIVVHAEILIALQQLFVTPLNYARESMSSATTLAVFLPMLDETNFIARFLSWIDLFRIWWLVSLAIGMGVLYKRPTGPIATGLLVLYGLFALVVAGVAVAMSGA
jgi:hypothetical protein